MKVWLLLLYFFVFNAYASIGTVVDTKGSSCEIVRSKNKLPGNKGASIESMDTYVTGNCIGNITFKDDTKVRVTENSRLLIDDFVYDPKKTDAGKLAVRVALGTVRYTSGQIAKTSAQNVDIKTPTASIAVRGTDFNMTVDEAGQSLIILVPSCKDESQVKQYELQENTCRVGKIEVNTLVGSVTLEQAFEATFVFSANLAPTPPVVVNITEGNINNNLIVSKPPEVQRAISDNSGGSKEPQKEAEVETAKQAAAPKPKEVAEEQQKTTLVQPVKLETAITAPPPSKPAPCNSSTSVCVLYERPEEDSAQQRGKGVAIRSNSDHYAEIKTQGYNSNTTVYISHDDNVAIAIIGSGDSGGNIVNIRQSTGVIKK